MVGDRMSTDAIMLLKQDHKEARAVFREFERAGEDKQKAGEIARKAIELLTIHTYIENECMYPEVRSLVPALDEDILESFEEHHVADVLCFELWNLDPSDEHFTAKMSVLIENVKHHMTEEEDVWFPKVREALSRRQLSDIGARMMELKEQAPREPKASEDLKKMLAGV